MVQAIQVLRFHLLELEKVSLFYYFTGLCLWQLIGLSYIALLITSLLNLDLAASHNSKTLAIFSLILDDYFDDVKLVL